MCKKTKFTPPSPIKATTKDITDNSNGLSLTSVVIVMTAG